MLLMKPNSPNYTTVFPMYELLGDFTEKDKINYAKDIFDELESQGTPVLEYRHPRKGYKLGVYELNGYVYFFQCLKVQGVFKNNLYVAVSSHKDDFVKICKYLEKLYYGSSIN